MRELNSSELMQVAGGGDVPAACSTDTLLASMSGGAVSGAFAGASGGFVGAVAGAIFGAAIGGAAAAIGCAFATGDGDSGGCS